MTRSTDNIDVLTHTKEWFEQAVPTPTKDTQRVQLGCHAEEFCEMLESMRENSIEDRYRIKLDAATSTLTNLANTLKKNPDFELQIKDRKELLDSLCDQIVTATGVAHTFGFDIIGALAEVNRSNYSKFVNGVPQFNENGKISKGEFYSKPDLTPYMGTDPTTL